MSTKVYGISGYTHVEIKLQVGKAVMPIVFERGCLDRKHARPATFTTSDKFVQDVIENSDIFGRTIKLYRKYGTDSVPNKPSSRRSTATSRTAKTAKVEAPAELPEAEAPASSDEADNSKKIIDTVTTKAEAVEYLKGLGAYAMHLTTDEGILKSAAKYHVSFPNLKF